MNMLAIFRSRAQSMSYAGRLYKYGVANQTVPTPKEAGIGCGLCVRFDASDLPRAKAVLNLGGGFSTFRGFYKYEYVMGRRVLVRV